MIKHKQTYGSIFPVALALLILGLAAFLLTGGSIFSPRDRKCELVIEKSCFALERADTIMARQNGLSGREEISNNSAMLFIFDKPATQCMWMKDMKFDIDIIWLNEDKKINKVKNSVSPSTYPETFCADDTKYVIELAGGSLNAYGLNDQADVKF